MERETLTDVPGGTHLEHEYGERFRGWYAFKTPLKKEKAPLNYRKKEIEYEFTISEHVIRFVMPSALEFEDGLITYTNGERDLGVFRFPRDGDGKFCAPIHLGEKELDDMVNSSEGELKRLLSRKPPLVFEAFRIEQFCFQCFDLDIKAERDISLITNLDFADSLRMDHLHYIDERMNEIRDKIMSLPNYLLILRNVLSRQREDYDEVSIMTNKIIFI